MQFLLGETWGTFKAVFFVACISADYNRWLCDYIELRDLLGLA